MPKSISNTFQNPKSVSNTFQNLVSGGVGGVLRKNVSFPNIKIGSKSFNINWHAILAQMVERLICNQRVAGSKPADSPKVSSGIW